MRRFRLLSLVLSAGGVVPAQDVVVLARDPAGDPLPNAEVLCSPTWWSARSPLPPVPDETEPAGRFREPRPGTYRIPAAGPVTLLLRAPEAGQGALVLAAPGAPERLRTGPLGTLAAPGEGAWIWYLWAEAGNGALAARGDKVMLPRLAGREQPLPAGRYRGLVQRGRELHALRVRVVAGERCTPELDPEDLSSVPARADGTRLVLRPDLVVELDRELRAGGLAGWALTPAASGAEACTAVLGTGPWETVGLSPDRRRVTLEGPGDGAVPGAFWGFSRTGLQSGHPSWRVAVADPEPVALPAAEVTVFAPRIGVPLHVEVAAGAGVRPVEFPRRRELRVRVETGEGRGVAHALVGWTSPATLEVQRLTDARGELALAGVPRIEGELWVDDGAHVPVRRAVEGSTESIRIVLREGTALRGEVVLPEGVAAQDVLVVARTTGGSTAVQRQAGLDGQGRFEVPGLPEDVQLVVTAVAVRGSATWRGRRSGVTPDTSGLVLELTSEDPPGPGADR